MVAVEPIVEQACSIELASIHTPSHPTSSNRSPVPRTNRGYLDHATNVRSTRMISTDTDAPQTPRNRALHSSTKIDPRRLESIPSSDGFLIQVASASAFEAQWDATEHTPTDSHDGERSLLLGESSLPLATEPEVQKDRVALGMAWYAASSFFFAGMGICSKILTSRGYPVWEITLVRAVIILVCSLSVLIQAGDNPLGVRRGLLLVRGTLGFASITCFFLACHLLPIAEATTFTFLAPLIVALLSPLALNEHPGTPTLIVIPVCSAGVLLITRPAWLFGGTGSALDATGVFIALLQPFFSAGAKMTVRVLRSTEKVNVMVFYLVMCTFIYSSVGCLYTWSSLILPTTSTDILILLAQGLFGYGNQICITNGLANARAASVMCMQYFSIVISQLAGMLLFDEFTTMTAGVGMSLVIASMVVYLWWENRPMKPPASPSK